MFLLKNWKFLLNFTAFSLIMYMILMIFAMLVYPEPSGYSFWGNFFSDLGYQNTESGLENPISFVLLLIANIFMLFVGVITNLLVLAYYKLHNFKKKHFPGPIIAMTTYLILPAIILYKKDVYVIEHELTAIYSFTAGFFSAIYICISFYNLNIKSKQFFFACYIYLFFTAAYGLFPLFFPGILEISINYRSASQKLSVISLILFLIQFWIMIRKLYSKSEILIVERF